MEQGILAPLGDGSARDARPWWAGEPGSRWGTGSPGTGMTAASIPGTQVTTRAAASGRAPSWNKGPHGCPVTRNSLEEGP